MQADGAERTSAALKLEQARAQADLRVSKQQARPTLCNDSPTADRISASLGPLLDSSQALYMSIVVSLARIPSSASRCQLAVWMH